MKKSGLRQEYYDCEIVYRDKIKKALSEMLLEKHLLKMNDFFKVLGENIIKYYGTTPMWWM